MKKIFKISLLSFVLLNLNANEIKVNERGISYLEVEKAPKVVEKKDENSARELSDINQVQFIKKQYEEFNRGQKEESVEIKRLDQKTLQLTKIKLGEIIEQKIKLLNEQKDCIDSSLTEEDIFKCNELFIYKTRMVIANAKNKN